MEKEIDTGLGYCSQCKKFDRRVEIYDIEATPPGEKGPGVEGLFLENEVKFKENGKGWIGIEISGKAFEGCEFEYADEEKITQVCKVTGDEMCPFHCVGFNWGSESYYLIDCDCLHTEFSNYIELKNNSCKIAPCLRDEEFYDFSDVEYNSVSPIIVEDTPSTVIVQKKLPGELVVPIILKASRFVHAITYNVDNYFLGILQTLAVKGVDVLIALNPGTLSKGKLKTILNVSSYSRRNLQIIVNRKVHAKRIFIDGIYDLDLASINLSYKALYDNIENIPEISFSTPSLSEKNWEIIRDTHNQKFIPAFEEGMDIFEWCSEQKPDVYEECSGAIERRKKEKVLIEKMGERKVK